MTNADYRRLYKGLRAFFGFSFKLPHYKKEFSPQQKAAITRKFSRIRDYINDDFSIKKSDVSFLKYPPHNKLRGVDGIRTDKGLIYKWPQASVKKSKVEKNKYLVVINPKLKRGAQLVQKRRDVFIPFPEKILHNPQLIAEFVARMQKKYGPHAIQWGYRDTRSRVIFDVEKLELYISTDSENDFTEIRELVTHVTRRYKNLLHTDETKRKAAQQKFTKSDTYQFLDDTQRRDFWAALNYYKSARRDDFTYNGVFFIYFI